jgi:signal transduction histidine kinase
MARPNRRERVALAELLSDLVEKRHEDSPVPLELEVQATPRVSGRAAALALAVDNLIDNAVRASPAGGVVKVRLGSDGGRAVIEVVDEGRGPQQLDGLFEPFASGDGLGLAASQAIARAHGGIVELKAAAPTTFRLLLPQ